LTAPQIQEEIANCCVEETTKLLKLVLVLPVAIASVERVFSVMNYVKNKLRNKIGDQYLNDYFTFIEREFFLQVMDKNISLPNHEESQD